MERKQEYIMTDKQNYQAAITEQQEILDYYGGQLKTIRCINKELEVKLNIAIDEARMYKRERNFLLPLVISMALWIATA